MRILREMNAYKRDLKRIKKSGSCSLDDILSIIVLLLHDSSLPEHLRDHSLSGPYGKFKARECHLKPDLLLIYAKPENELHLLRIGSHSELFG